MFLLAKIQIDFTLSNPCFPQKQQTGGAGNAKAEKDKHPSFFLKNERLLLDKMSLKNSMLYGLGSLKVPFTSH